MTASHPGARPVASWWLTAVAAVVMLGAACGSSSNSDAAGQTSAPMVTTTVESAVDTQPASPEASVVRVVDGDTIVARIGGSEERVRLIGIDTPESESSTRPLECYGPEASAYTTALLPEGTPLRLERDLEARDQYGRLLAYVYRAGDDEFVNLALVEDGYAATLEIEPNTAYSGLFRQAEDDARAAGQGLWGECGGPDLVIE